MNNVATRSHNATAIDASVLNKLRSGIAESRATTVIAGGKPLLRLLKDAHWVFGQKDDPVQENSSWAINTLSIAHGWVAWTNHEGSTKNTMVGEQMVPIFEPKPARPAPVDGWPFSEQRMFELKCMDGEDEGQEVLYKSASYGGMQAVDALLAAIQKQLDDYPLFPCPVVVLESDSYPHPKWGKVYNPIFNIVDWASMDGKLQSEAASAANGNGADRLPPFETATVAPTPQPTPAQQPTPQPLPRRTRGAAAAAPAAAQAPSEPAPTARRRPVRRG